MNLSLYLGMLWLWICSVQMTPEHVGQPLSPPQVKLVTSHGTIVLRLYEQTPLHRDNFIKNVKEGVYDSVLFHRVIGQFMVQSGDPKTRPSAAKDSVLPELTDPLIPAEMRLELFHKKGVLAAARTGNPERASSPTQFYIVQGKVMNDSLLDHAETRINGWLAQHQVMHDPANAEKLESLKKAMKNEDMANYSRIQREFAALASSYEDFEPYKIPDAHRQVYKTLGGTPHLDQNYTVFGEVVSGLEVVDLIAGVETDKRDKPLEDVWILSAKILED